MSYTPALFYAFSGIVRAAKGLIFGMGLLVHILKKFTTHFFISILLFHVAGVKWRQTSGEPELEQESAEER